MNNTITANEAAWERHHASLRENWDTREEARKKAEGAELGFAFGAELLSEATGNDALETEIRLREDKKEYQLWREPVPGLNDWEFVVGFSFRD